jgi:hypothetical protein
MKHIRDLKVTVLSFPADEFCRGELMNMTDEKLIETATKSPSCKIWGDLEAFQASLNLMSVDTENNWIIFTSLED